MYQEQRRWNERQARKHLESVAPLPNWSVDLIWIDDVGPVRMSEEWPVEDDRPERKRMTKADVKASKKQRRENRKGAEQHYEAAGWGGF